MIGFVKSFENNITMSFKITDKQLLKKYNQIWKKVKDLLNIENLTVNQFIVIMINT